MFPSYRIVFGTAALVAIGILSGCSSRVPNEQQKATAPAQKTVQEVPSKQADHASHEGHEQVETAPASLPAGLAELSAEDRAVAEKQRVCPVSGDVLGAHDKPYKVTVKGQIVFLCCSACEKQLLANPDKYLAKLHSDKPK
jgi:hypothetical protein